MSNTNNTMKTQTSNTLHNAIMEDGGKDRLPMLALGNYVQWKSRIKRYIDTKPNHELIHYCLKNPLYKYTWADKVVPVLEGSPETTTERYMENYKNVSQDIRDQLNAKAEAVQIILTGIDNNIYSTFDACPNACEMWKAIKRLKQGESINSQELKAVSYHKLYDILKQHQNEVNELKAERIARTANPLALVAQQQPVYHPQNHPTHYTQHSSTKSQQAATRNRGKAIVNSYPPIYDQEPSMVTEDDEIANQDNSLRINKGTGYNNKARECQKPKRVKDAAYHRKKMLLCKQEEAGIQLNAEQADWKDDTDDESEDQELEAHYMYMAQIQEVSRDAADDSGPIFDTEPLQKELEAHYMYMAQIQEVSRDAADDSGPIFDTEPLQKINQNDDDDDLANERELLASLIAKLKVISTTSVSRPQIKSYQMEDRVMLNNSQGKKQEVEDHRRNVKFSKTKTSITACNDSLNAKTSNVNFVCATCGQCVMNTKHDMCVLKSLKGVNSRNKMPIAVPVSTREPKRTVNKSVVKPLRRTVASESTNQKPRNTTRKLYEHVSKECSWWYPKFTPPGYKWKHKSKIGNVNLNVSMPLGNASRTANILEHMTHRRSIVSNTTLYSNSFTVRRDYPIHRRLWVLKAHDGKSQASN
nr:hypothetical protein [Tanacetum cinerariifolium]